MGGASVGLNLHRFITDNFGFRGEFQITESLIMSDFVRASQLDSGSKVEGQRSKVEGLISW